MLRPVTADRFLARSANVVADVAILPSLMFVPHSGPPPGAAGGAPPRARAAAKIAAQSVVEDLNSTNGVYVKATRVTHHELKDGDVIQLGEHKLLYRDLRRALATASFDEDEEDEEDDDDDRDAEEAEPEELDEKQGIDKRLSKS